MRTASRFGSCTSWYWTTSGRSRNGGIRAALEAAGAVPPTIEVEPVHAIELEPGSSKLKVVKTVREVAA